MFLTMLARPEAPLLAGLFALGLAWRVRWDWRAWLVVILTFGLPFLAYEVWRWGHFDISIPFGMPHSAVCKADYVSDKSPLTDDLLELFKPLVLLALVYPWRKLGPRHLVMWGVPVAYFFVLHGVDPIIGYWNRHGLLAFALLALAAGVGLVQAARVMGPRARPALREAVVLLLALSYVAVFQEDPAEPLKKRADMYARRMETRGQAGDWLKARVRPEDWVLVGDVGRIPYELDAHVLDAFCLNCLEYTSDAIDGDPGRFADYVFLLKPRFLVIHSARRDRLRPRGEYGVFPAVVRNPGFRAEYDKAVVFGAKGDPFQYWIYQRRDRASD